MAFSKKKLTQGRMERRRRLLIILPDVVSELEKKRKDSELTGKQIKEIDLALKGVDPLPFMPQGA